MEKILIVEDDHNLIILLQTILQKEGYLVMTAPCGKMALDWLVNSKPDLVVLDIGLPDMSGIKICEKIKSDRTLRRIPVIILTAYEDNKTKIQANLDAQADLFLNKPIDNKDFKSAIRTLLKKASANNALRRNLFKKTAR